MAHRIEEHPVLGDQTAGRKKVRFLYNGTILYGFEGEPVAAALLANGIRIHRYTAKMHQPRGVFCAIGRCTDCVMVVNGVPNIRTCMFPLAEGTDVRTQYGVSDQKFDVQEADSRE